MDFKESEKINVTKHMEKKGRFTYLSWPFAVSEFRKNYPNGAWDVSTMDDSGQPYSITPAGCFVEVSVTPDCDKPALTFTQVHPVLNNQNKTVVEPNAFEVNTSIQRCLVKAIALATGIGLHIYAGEDLPPSEDTPKPEPKKTPVKKETPPKKHPKQGDIDGWIAAWEIDLKAGADKNAWWAEKSAGIKKDCTDTGAKLVYTEVMK